MDTLQKIERAFDQKTREEFGHKFLDLLYENWREDIRALRRAVLFVALLIFSFLLLDDGKAGAFTLGPLKTDNVSSILILLPAIISFLLFEAVDLTLTAALRRDAVRALIERLHPSVSDNQLQLLIEPTLTFAWGGGSLSLVNLRRSEGRIARFLENATVVAIGVTIFMICLFLVYAYWDLFNNSRANCFAVVASLLFTLFNLLRASLQLIAFYTERNSPQA